MRSLAHWFGVCCLCCIWLTPAAAWQWPRRASGAAEFEPSNLQFHLDRADGVDERLVFCGDAGTRFYVDGREVRGVFWDCGAERWARGPEMPPGRLRAEFVWRAGRLAEVRVKTR